jgi:hypothetical protein
MDMEIDKRVLAGALPIAREASIEVWQHRYAMPSAVAVEA